MMLSRPLPMIASSDVSIRADTSNSAVIWLPSPNMGAPPDLRHLETVEIGALMFRLGRPIPYRELPERGSACGEDRRGFHAGALTLKRLCFKLHCVLADYKGAARSTASSKRRIVRAPRANPSFRGWRGARSKHIIATCARTSDVRAAASGATGRSRRCPYCSADSGAQTSKLQACGPGIGKVETGMDESMDTLRRSSRPRGWRSVASLDPNLEHGAIAAVAIVGIAAHLLARYGLRLGGTVAGVAA